MEGEYSCYRSGPFKGGRMVITEVDTYFNGGRMVMLQRCNGGGQRWSV